MSCSAKLAAFQGKDVNEEFHFCFHQHWIRLLWPLSKLLIQSTLIISIGYVILVEIGVENDVLRRVLLIALTLLFTLTQAEFLTRFYRYFLYVIVITDKRVHRIKKTLLTIDDHQTVDLWMLQDIFKYQHGILQNLLGYGSLILEAQETMLRLHFVPNISDKYMQLMRLRERARMRPTYMTKASENDSMQEKTPEHAEKRAQGIYFPHALPVS